VKGRRWPAWSRYITMERVGERGPGGSGSAAKAGLRGACSRWSKGTPIQRADLHVY